MPKNAAAVMLPLLVMVLSSCASPLPPASVPVEVRPAKLAPLPADVMIPRQSNFRERLQQIFSRSQTTPTPSPINSEPAKQSR